jgi:hypothetical protein
MAGFPTAAQTLNHARPKHVAPFSDFDILASCTKCSVERRLSDCAQENTIRAKNYRCPGCDEILVVTQRPNAEGVPVPASGIRLGEWVFANAVDVRIEGFPELIISACTNAASQDAATIFPTSFRLGSARPHGRTDSKP